MRYVSLFIGLNIDKKSSENKAVFFLQVIPVLSFSTGERQGPSFFLTKGLGVDFGVVHTQGWPSYLLGKTSHKINS